MTRDQVAAEMQSAAGATAEQAADVLKLAELAGTNADILRQLGPLVGTNETGQAGVAKLSDLLAAAQAAGVPEERLKLDVSIARGLDYYTGMIFETFLTKLPKIGSVCSGGRYDNLAGLYTSQQLPGIGASLGLDRLLAALEELGLLAKVSTPADVFLPYFDAARLHDYLRLAAQLRSAGLGVEVYPDTKRLGDQLKYADRRGFRFAVVIGEQEFAEQKCQLKDLSDRSSTAISLAAGPAELVAAIRERQVK